VVHRDSPASEAVRRMGYRQRLAHRAEVGRSRRAVAGTVAEKAVAAVATAVARAVAETVARSARRDPLLRVERIEDDRVHEVGLHGVVKLAGLAELPDRRHRVAIGEQPVVAVVGRSPRGIERPP
jgi:hypothetical protein